MVSNVLPIFTSLLILLFTLFFLHGYGSCFAVRSLPSISISASLHHKNEIIWLIWLYGSEFCIFALLLGLLFIAFKFLGMLKFLVWRTIVWFQLFCITISAFQPWILRSAEDYNSMGYIQRWLWMIHVYSYLKLKSMV